MKWNTYPLLKRMKSSQVYRCLPGQSTKLVSLGCSRLQVASRTAIHVLQLVSQSRHHEIYLIEGRTFKPAPLHDVPEWVATQGIPGRRTLQCMNDEYSPFVRMMGSEEQRSRSTDWCTVPSPGRRKGQFEAETDLDKART